VEHLVGKTGAVFSDTGQEEAHFDPERERNAAPLQREADRVREEIREDAAQSVTGEGNAACFNTGLRVKEDSRLAVCGGSRLTGCQDIAVLASLRAFRVELEAGADRGQRCFQLVHEVG